MTSRVAVIVKGYPRLSETFIAQELLGLEQHGLALHIVSLRRPTDGAVHPVHREISAPVLYLPEYLHEAPLRVWRAWRAARSLPGYRNALGAWLADLWRDLTRSRVRRFGQALVLAHELPEAIGHLHAHFLHTPASVARYASLLTGLPWSCSAHAKDIWTTETWDKCRKLASLAWLVTCTRAGAEHLAGLAPSSTRVELLYHGIDLARFPAPQRAASARDGSDHTQPVSILSVGRLVDKKGYETLLEALARLPRELHWRLTVLGGGPLGDSLKRRATELGLAAHVTWLGAQPQDAVLAEYRKADLFALASRVTADGDRDGLPNVLVEAQSQGLPCVSTTAGAAAELIADGTSGLLVPPDDPAAFAMALERLVREPLFRRHLGAAALKRVHEAFAFEPGIARLAAKFGVNPEIETNRADAAPASCASRSMRR